MSGSFKVGPVAALDLTNPITFSFPLGFRAFMLRKSCAHTCGAAAFLISLSDVDCFLSFRIYHFIDRRLAPLGAFKSAGPFRLLQPERVNPCQRVLGIFVGVEPAKQPYRIL